MTDNFAINALQIPLMLKCVVNLASRASPNGTASHGIELKYSVKYSTDRSDPTYTTSKFLPAAANF